MAIQKVKAIKITCDSCGDSFISIKSPTKAICEKYWSRTDEGKIYCMNCTNKEFIKMYK